MTKSQNRFDTIIVIISMSIIYAIATGLYFSGMYLAADRGMSIDEYFEGYFYLLNIVGILAISFFMKNHYTCKRMFAAYTGSLMFSVVLTYFLFLPLSNNLFNIILFLLFITIGCTQGSYVFLITLFIPKDKRCMSLAIGASMSVIFNYLFSLINDSEFVKSFSVIVVYTVISVAGCLLLLFYFQKTASSGDIKIGTDNSDNPSEAAIVSSSNSIRPKVFIVTLVFITLSWIIQSLAFYFPYNDSLVLGISPEIFRITNILGLLLGGYINNRDKKIGAISCLIILATPMLYIILQQQAGVTLLVFLLSYFFTGILSIYRFGIIADMSDEVNSKGNSLTWLCAFGLIFGRLGESFGALLGIRLSQNTLLLVTVSCFILVIAVAFFIFHYIHLFIPIPKVIQSHEDIMNSFKIKYGISNREMDVLELLLDGKTNNEIADKLFVSENTIRFHVSNILKKTECKSRKEISALFYNS